MPVNELSLLINDVIPMRSKKDHDSLLNNLQMIVSRHKYGKSRLAEITVNQVVGEDDFTALVVLYKSGHTIKFNNSWLNQKWTQLMEISFKDAGYSIFGKVVDFSNSAYEFTKETAKKAYKASKEWLRSTEYRENMLDYEDIYEDLYEDDFEDIIIVV